MNKSDLKRIDALEAKVVPPTSEDHAIMRKANEWLLAISGRTTMDLCVKELLRIERMLMAWPRDGWCPPRRSWAASTAS
jgi:hypothetical protein